MHTELSHGFRIGQWKIEPLSGAISGPDNRPHHLQPKVMDVLICLAENENEPVTREELLDRVWGERVVSDEVLTRAIGELRRALGDDRGDPTYIETIPKRGYRLIGEVQLPDRSSVQATSAKVQDEATTSGRHAPGWFGRSSQILGIASLLIAAIGYWLIANFLWESSPDDELAGHLDDDSAIQIIVQQSSVIPEKSVAVLPFQNRSALEEDVHFVDGVHDDVVTQLSKLSSLTKVISRTTMEQYRDTEKSMPQIGEELGVSAILQGGVQRSGNRVRINMQLIDSQRDNHLWAETYDRQLTAENLFSIQTDIAREVAMSLQVVLTERANARLRVLPTDNLDAYEEFVLGRREISKRTAESVRRAQEHFERAIELDDEYALAYVGLADSIYLQVNYSARPRTETYALRQAAIDKALALDPLLGEAYASLATLKVNKNENAERYFLKAIELSPNHPAPYSSYSWYLRQVGRDEAALQHIRKAIELDPLEPSYTDGLARTLRFLGRAEEAQTALRKGIERNPDYPEFYALMAIVLNSIGEHGESMRWIRAGASLETPTRLLMWEECDTYLHLGDDESSEKCANKNHAISTAVDDQNYGYVQLNLHIYRSEYQDAARLMERLLESNPNVRAKHNMAQVYLLNGNVDGARSIWEEVLPDLYGTGRFIIKPNDIRLTVLVAYTLYVDGKLDRANYLFDQALDTMQSMHRTRGRAFYIWDSFIHATRGDNGSAISALRDAIDAGWRIDWWLYPRFPAFDSVREEPEWIELMSELQADIARQRDWYEEHKNEPLL